MKFSRILTSAALLACCILCSLVATGCSSATNVYHVGEHGWLADSIYFRVFKTSDSTAHPSLPDMNVVCRSCNLINAPTDLHFDSLGFARIYLPESIHLLSSRLHVAGKGIDTTFIQKIRSPREATDYYHLRQPLIGRILVTQLAMLYADSTIDSVVTNAQTGDEVNIFSDNPLYYRVHHPLFSHPLYLLKSNAIRLY